MNREKDWSVTLENIEHEKINQHVNILKDPYITIRGLSNNVYSAVADEIGKILKKEQKTAVMVTHDISEAISMGDRVIVLSKRPATIKSIHAIQLTLDVERTPLASREAPEFRHYFNTIWKELDVHVK